MQKKTLTTPRLLELKRQRRKAIFIRIFLFSLAIGGIFCISVYLSRLPGLNINAVEVSGNEIIDTESIRQAVMNEMSGKYLWLFPKTNMLIYPKNSIRAKLGDDFKRLTDIRIYIKDKTLQLSVDEREAKYTWCGASLPTGNGGKCYFMDMSGYIFDEAPYFSGEVFFQFYGADDVNTDDPAGSYFSMNNFKQLVSFKDILIDLGLKPVALYSTKDGDINVYLTGGNSLDTDPKIIFKKDADFQNVEENLQAALSTDPLKSKMKTKYSALEYIDLRFGNKVYDKFR